MPEPEELGNAVADTVTEAIEDAQRQEAIANETAEMIAGAALESERGRRIEDLERRFDTWESQQSDQSEAIAALTLGLTELTGQMSALSMLLTPAASPTPNPQNAGEDGPPENPEPAPEIVVETETQEPEPEPEPPAPKKKKHRWI